MKIGVIGCAGRMGRAVIAEALSHDAYTLVSGLERDDAPCIGKDLALLVGAEPIGVTATNDTQAVISAADAIIDFTIPEVTLACAPLAAEHNTVHVIGTTGFSDEQLDELAVYAKKTPIVMAPNMSMGVNLLVSLVEKVAGILDDDFDIEVVEMHHRHKIDAPSGTALALGKAAAAGRDVALDAVEQRTRDGRIGERKRGEIGFATLRGGDVVGDHTVMFAGDGERIELTHKASSRQIYAKGALRAALWAKECDPGIYSMQDVLGI